MLAVLVISLRVIAVVVLYFLLWEGEIQNEEVPENNTIDDWTADVPFTEVLEKEGILISGGYSLEYYAEMDEGPRMVVNKSKPYTLRRN